MRVDDVADLIAPKMPLKPLWPAAISESNQELQQSPPETTQAAMDAHLFPWNGLILIFILIMLVIALKSRPQKPVRRERTVAIQEKALSIFANAPTLEGYISLTDTVRELLKERVPEEIAGKTTEELIVVMQKSSTLDFRTQEMLSHFLKDADLVKFAQHSPTPHEWKRAHSTLTTLIK